MKDKLDQLFKKKAEGYQKQPSAEAWNKIHRNLNPRSRVPVWQIAASVLLIAGVAAVIYLQLNTEGNHTPATASQEIIDSVQKNDQKVPEENMLAQQNTTTEKTTETVEEDQTEKPGETVKKPLHSAPEKEEILIAEKTAKPVREIIEEIEPIIPEKKEALANAEEIPVNPVAEAEVNATETKAESTQKRPVVTIVYQKSNPENTAVAQNEEKDNKDGLGKIFNLAKELKNSDLNLSEIRDVKDELLALDINIRRNNTKTRD